MHIQGKAYAWWLFESSSLNNANISTYEKFTWMLVKRFDLKQSKASLGKQTKPKKSEPLHELEGSMKPTSFPNIFEGVKDLQHTFPREKFPLQQ